MVGNKGGRGVVGNKGGRGVVGNKGGRGVVGNKGNTTAGQSKVNAAGKRKSFKGNMETGESKRSAGKRSGLIRRAKHALVGQERWLDKILDGEKLRRLVVTMPGGLLLFDGILDHKGLASPQAARAVDDKGRLARGCISLVWMPNIQTPEYQTPECRLCREQTASDVVPRRKKTAGGITFVLA